MWLFRARHQTAKEIVDESAPDGGLAGRVAIVTGGNSGIGLETVKALSSAGCHVVMTSRSVEAGLCALEEEVKKPGVSGYAVPDAKVDVHQLDLANLGSVVAFAQEVRRSRQRLDYLVLNAGVMAIPTLEHTDDGFEKHIGTNHFGHALLVRLLRPVLEAQPCESRVVTLASDAHKFARTLEVGNLHFLGEAAGDYGPWAGYGASKLANVLFARTLARSLPADGKVASVSVHPGVIRTNLYRTTAWGFVAGFLGDKDIPRGAATTLWACLSKEAATTENAGAYLTDCEIGRANSKGRDDVLADALQAETDRQLDAALAKRGFGPDGTPLR